MNNDNRIEVQATISEDDRNSLMQGMGRHLIQAAETGPHCNQYEHKPGCPHENGTEGDTGKDTKKALSVLSSNKDNIDSVSVELPDGKREMSENASYDPETQTISYTTSSGGKGSVKISSADFVEKTKSSMKINYINKEKEKRTVHISFWDKRNDKPVKIDWDND